MSGFNPQPKFEYFRSEKHLNAIRALWCCECGESPRSQAAHINSSLFGKGGKIKASDEAVIPLCLECHQGYDQTKRSRNEMFIWFVNHLRLTANRLSSLGELSPDAKRLLIERGVL